MPYECLLTRRTGAVEYVSVNRPEVRNAFNEQLIAELTQWAQHAAGDPSLRLRCEHLLATIATQLDALGRRRAATDRMAAACACLVDYDSFARHLGDQLRRTDHGDFRTSLAALGRRIRDLRDRCPATSAEARLLTTLAHGVARMQRTLDHAA